MVGAPFEWPLDKSEGAIIKSPKRFEGKVKLTAVIIQIYGIRKSKLDHEQVKQTNPYQ